MFGLGCQCLRQRENRSSGGAASSRRASAVSSSIQRLWAAGPQVEKSKDKGHRGPIS